MILYEDCSSGVKVYIKLYNFPFISNNKATVPLYTAQYSTVHSTRNLPVC